MKRRWARIAFWAAVLACSLWAYTKVHTYSTGQDPKTYLLLAKGILKDGPGTLAGTESDERMEERARKGREWRGNEHHGDAPGVRGAGAAAEDGDVVAGGETHGEIGKKLLGPAQDLAVAGQDENDVLFAAGGRNCWFVL